MIYYLGGYLESTGHQKLRESRWSGQLQPKSVVVERVKRMSHQNHRQLNRTVLHEDYDDWQLQKEDLPVWRVKGEAFQAIRAKY